MTEALLNHKPFSWKNVSIGGGGFVSSVFLHPRMPESIYFATNVGGLFRWDEKAGRSIPLTDRFTLEQSRYYPINGLALHPENPDVLYLAAGDYADQKTGRPGAIFKSTDRGSSWKQATPPDWPVKVGGMNYPWVIQRLAVDPNHPDIVLYGSNVDGLWRSCDAGAGWKRVANLDGVSSARSTPFADESLIGIIALEFDPHIPGRVYAAVFTHGLYRSDDSGATWTEIPHGPRKAFRLAVTNDGALWASCKPARGEGGIGKYAGGRWRYFNPSGKRDGFSALAVNPANPDEILAATWWIKGPFSHENLYRTVDGGEHWTRVEGFVEHTQAWLPDEDFDVTIASLAYDPSVPGRVWLTGGYAVYRTEEISARRVCWTPLNKNLEDTYIFDLVECDDGRLISAIADLSGFVHDQGLEAYPSRRLYEGDQGLSKAIYTYSLARTCTASPQVIARAASQFKGFFSGVLISEDGGQTWRTIKRFVTIPFVGKGYPFQVAISPGDPRNLVVTRVKARPLFTRNGGRRWRQVKGLPEGLDHPGAPFSLYARPLAADGAQEATFYYYHAGVVYRSQDGGASFTPVCSGLPVESSNKFYALHGVPGKAQEVWLNLESNGLYHSVDGGAAWVRIEGVRGARLFATGKAAPGSPSPSLYLYGTVADISGGIFISTDGGRCWENIQDPMMPVGATPYVMEASRQTFGLVYIGAAGRGIYYGTPQE